MRKSIQLILAFSAFAVCATLFTGCSAKARMARHQQRADSYYAAGDFPKAEVEYLIALRLDNSNAHAISRLGDIYYQEGRMGRAFAYVQKANEMSTNNADIQTKLGAIYLAAHKNKEARDIAEVILSYAPTNADAPDILAESILTRADSSAVEKQLDKLSKQIGDTAPLELAMGIVNYANGDLKAAEVALQRALTLDPKYSAAYYTLGNLYLAQKNTKDAEPLFKKAAELSPLRSPRRLSYANFKIQNGDVPEGKRLIAEISKAAPDYVPAWIRQAEIALTERKFDECETLISHALASDADSYEALFLRGRLCLLRNQPDKAIAEFSRMAALYDQSPDVEYQLALAYLAGGDQSKASVALGKAVTLQPKFTDAVLVLAGLNLARGDTVSTITALTKLVAEQPKLGEAYVMLGNAYVLQKNPDMALAAYSKAVEIYPENPQVPFLLGMVWVQKKDYTRARKAYERTLALAPTFSRALEELANIDITEGKFTAALDRVNKLTDEQLGSGREMILAKIYVARAQSVARKESGTTDTEVKLTSPTVQGDVTLAETAMTKAIDLAPTQAGPYLMLAQLYVATGKQQAALDRLNALVAKTNSSAAYMQIGMVNEAIKDYPKARDAYEKALTISPDSDVVLNNLSYLYAERLGNPDKALPLAEKVRQLAPKDPATADTLGWIVFKKGDYTRARALLEESAAKMPDQMEVQFHVGMVRYMMGDEDLARGALQAAAASTADFPGKDEAAQRLATMAINPKTADAKTQADLEKRLQQEPKDAVAAERLGEIYELNGALDKAVKTYEQSLKQNPQNPPAMGRLANVYFGLHQSDKALDMAKDAHKLAPADANISALLGRLVFQTGDFSWSASLLQDAAGKLPNRPDVQYDLAWALYSLGRVDEAQRTMQGAVPTLTGARLEDAKVFLTMLAAAKTPAMATAAPATQVLNTNADYVPAMMVAGVQAEQQGKGDDAVQLYSKALTRYPAFVPAARNLAILYSKRAGGDDQKAYDLAAKSRAQFPDDNDLTRALGILAYRHGEFTRAVQFLQESSLTLTNDGEVFYYLGMAQYQLKHLPQTKTALQRALALKITAPSADDARKVLAELK